MTFQGGKSVGALWSLFSKGTNSIMRAPHLWANHHTKASPPNIIRLGVGCQRTNFGRDTNIQSIAQVNPLITTQSRKILLNVFYWMQVTIETQIVKTKSMAGKRLKVKGNYWSVMKLDLTKVLWAHTIQNISCVERFHAFTDIAMLYVASGRAKVTLFVFIVLL